MCSYDGKAKHDIYYLNTTTIQESTAKVVL